MNRFLPCLLLLSFLASAPRDAGAEDPFVGSWSLVSWTRPSAGGEKTFPYGEDAFGRLVYLPNGRMAAILMQRNRGEAPSGGRGTEGGFFAYSGTYTVDEKAAKVTHHVEACGDPAWVGSERVRTFELLGPDRLRLRTEETASELIWQREK